MMENVVTAFGYSYTDDQRCLVHLLAEMKQYFGCFQSTMFTWMTSITNCAKSEIAREEFLAKKDDFFMNDRHCRFCFIFL